MLTLQDCWAKTTPFQSVLTHAKVSGIVAKCIYRRYISEGDRMLLRKWLHRTDEQVASFIAYLVSLHDIGKIEALFQEKSPEQAIRLKNCNMYVDKRNYENVRHERTSNLIMRNMWLAQAQERRAVKTFAEILGAHHQGKCGKEGSPNRDGWRTLQGELEGQMRNLFLGETLEIPAVEKGLEAKIQALLLGITILSDWIASGKAFADAETWVSTEHAEKTIVEKTEAFLQESQLAPCPEIWASTFCGVWSDIPQVGMRPLQAEMERVFHEHKGRYRVILVEAPMGEGKTEAGLYAAVQMMKEWRKDGFYVALPTAATSNQMVERVRALLQKNSIDSAVRLLHSMAWLSDTESIERIDSEEEQDEIHSWLAPVRRGLLGQYAVGTVDQAMLAATTAKYGVLRLLGLSNKVLVIDEIHSYDVYMMEIIVRLLEWCKALEIPVVMLSATLPPELKEKLLRPYTDQSVPQSYPAITAVTEDGQPKVYPIRRTVKTQTVVVKLVPCLHDPERIAKLAVEQVEHGGCICVLMNTVKDAQAVYQEIKRQYCGDLMLFHAQFPAKRRTELEKRCIKKFGKDKSFRPKQAILVATQVVEQSLDVDFDGMITAVAPIDLLIQRMGRIFRHEETPRPKELAQPVQWVLVPDIGQELGINEKIYPPCLLKQSIYLLEQRQMVRIPEDLAELVAKGYDMEAAPKEVQKKWLEWEIENGINAGTSSLYTLNAPDKSFIPCKSPETMFQDDEQASFLTVKTRLGEPTVRIALLEPELFARVKQCSQIINGTEVAKVAEHDLARLVMEQSVSIRAKIVRSWNEKPRYCPIKGAILLAGVEIYPAEDGVFQCSGGSIRFDPELGVIIKEAEL